MNSENLAVLLKYLCAKFGVGQLASVDVNGVRSEYMTSASHKWLRDLFQQWKLSCVTVLKSSVSLLATDTKISI